MPLNTTKKGKVYLETGVDEINQVNKKLADEGKSVFEQYAEPMCKHGELMSECFICDTEDD